MLFKDLKIVLRKDLMILAIAATALISNDSNLADYMFGRKSEVSLAKVYKTNKFSFSIEHWGLFKKEFAFDHYTAMTFLRYPECTKTSKEEPYKGQHIFLVRGYWDDSELVRLSDFNCDGRGDKATNILNPEKGANPEDFQFYKDVSSEFVSSKTGKTLDQLVVDWKKSRKLENNNLPSESLQLN